MPRTILHIGAHKTATSYMQKKLALNVDLLRRRNIHYEPLDVFRKEFTRLLNSQRRVESEYVDELNEKAKTMTLLLSEENILGVPGDIIRKGRPYKSARERLERTSAFLRRPQKPAVFLSLREYSGFMVSMYSEYIRHREFVPFREYRALFEDSGFNWISLIEDVLAALPDAQLHIWDFADFRKIEKNVFEAMLGFDPDIFQNPEGPVRESFSDVAVRAFEALGTVIDHKDFKKLMGPISRQFPKGENYKAFDPIEPEAKVMLRARYQADLATISERWPDVTVIDKA